LSFETEQDFQIRQKLREYQALLSEYIVLRQSASSQDQASALEQRLQHQKSEIEGMQTARRMEFIGTFNSFQLVTYIKDLGPADVIAAVRRWRRDLAELPRGYGLPLFDGPFFEERRYLEDAIPHLEEALRQKNIPVPPEERPHHDPASTAASEVISKVEAIAKMNQQCEEMVKQYPDQEEMIRDMFRKFIDGFKR
jgi:hypothetical protein